MTKRIIIIGLCLCMLAATVSCTKTTDVAGTTSTQNTTAKPDETNATQDAAVTETGEPKVIKQLMSYKSFDPNLEPPVALIEELTGYKLEFYTLPSEGADEKLNIELSTGTEYDIMTLTPSQFYTLLSKGALLSFDESMEQYAPNLKNTFTEKEWSTAQYEGKTYGIPSFGSVYIASAIGYNQNIADEAGIVEKPTNIEEFTEFLNTVHTQKPEIITLTGSGSDYFSSPIASGFGLNGDPWVDVNGTLVNQIELPEFKEYLSYMAGLYSQGILDEEWPINTGENKDQKFTTGAAFADTREWFDVDTINPAVEQNTGSKVSYITLLKDDNGNQNYSYNAGSAGFASIPATCKDIDKVMDYLNLRAKPENIAPIFIGIEGVHHEVRIDESGNETYWPIFPAFNEWYSGNIYGLCNSPQVYTTLWLCRVRKSENLYSVFSIMNDVQEGTLTPRSISYAPPLDDVNKYTQATTKYADDFMVEIITGIKSIEDDYDAFLTQWKADGGQAMIDQVNAWYKGQ